MCVATLLGLNTDWSLPMKLNTALIQEQIDAWHRHVIGNIEYCKNNGTNYETDKYYLAAKLRHDNWQAILEAVQKPVNEYEDLVIRYIDRMNDPSENLEYCLDLLAQFSKEAVALIYPAAPKQESE
jgi:hypothetical protein